MVKFAVTEMNAATLGRLVLGGVFALAALSHIQTPFSFLSNILAYELVSGDVALVLSIVLPFVEMVLAVFFFTSATRNVPFWVSYFVLVVFFLAQVSVLVRGMEIDCGCFGGISQHEIGFVSIGLLVTLMVIALVSHYSANKLHCAGYGKKND